MENGRHLLRAWRRTPTTSTDLAFPLQDPRGPRVNPGDGRPPRYYVRSGTSNGARMAYRVAADDPGLFDGYAM